MKKRFFSLLIIPLCMFGMINGTKAATVSCEDGNPEAKIGDVCYDTLVNAFSEATDGNTIVLLKDITVENTAIVNSNGATLTFDLSGYRISSSSNTSGTFYINEVTKLTIVDNSPTKNGTIENTKGLPAVLLRKGELILEGGKYLSTNPSQNTNYGAIQIGTVSNNNTKLEVRDGVEIEGTSGINAVGDGQNITISGGNITGREGFAVAGNGKETTNSAITIKDGNLTSNENAAIYQPQTGTLTIEGGNITGKVGIVARQGTINVKGSTINANGTSGEMVVTGDAKDAEGNPINIPSGTGIIVDNSDKGKYGETKVTIDNGNFKTNDDAVKTLKEPVDEEKSEEIIVNGGNFNHPLKANYIASNKKQSAAGTVAEEDKIHNIELSEEIENGQIEVVTNAAEGEEVKVTITPNESYELDELIIRKKDGDKDIIELVEGKFTMPNSDVTISATFKIITTDNKEEDKPAVDNPDTGTNLPVIAVLGMLSSGVTLFVLGKKANKLS